MNYFLYRKGQVYGPYSEMDVNGFLSEGRVRLSDLAKTDALRDWTPLSAIWRAPSAGNSVTWPFHQRNWMESIWMTLLWWVPLPIPLGAFLSAGWIIDAVRRKSRGAADPLPRPENFGRIMIDGAVVLTFFWLYFVIPVLLIWWWTSFGIWTVSLRTLLWLFHYLRDEAPESLFTTLYHQVVLFEARPVTAVAYLALAWPVFTATTIRFAETGKARSFFNLPASLAVFFRHILGFAKFLVLNATVVSIAVLVAIIAALTGVGALFVIPLVAAAIWAITCFLGDLAARCSRRK